MWSQRVMLVTARLRQFVGVFLWLVLAVVVVVLRIAHAQQPSTQKPAAAPAQPALITGTSTTSEPTGVTVARRSFEPASRTYWHSHPGGQLLLIEARPRARSGAWEACQDPRSGREHLHRTERPALARRHADAGDDTVERRFPGRRHEVDGPCDRRPIFGKDAINRRLIIQEK